MNKQGRGEIPCSFHSFPDSFFLKPSPVRPPAPPVANFTASPTTGNAPLSVTFNDTSANAPTSWLWTFGDGTNSTIQHPVHISTSAGNYTVSLNVTNGEGANTTIKEKYISVFNPPPTTIPTITGLVKLLEIQHGEERLKNLMVY